MASFIMVAGYYFATEEERRDDGRGSGKGASSSSWIFCVSLVEHVSLNRDADSKVEVAPTSASLSDR
jgi:hypothetical protein